MERDGANLWRWSDGNAALPVTCAPPFVMEVELAGSLSYVVARHGAAPAQPALAD